jgi:hypothetical protein
MKKMQLSSRLAAGASGDWLASFRCCSFVCCTPARRARSLLLNTVSNSN